MKKTIKSFILILVILIITYGGSVVAGEGDGSGGGKTEPLSLESSTISDNEKNVDLDREIRLTFSKNVVNMTVKDNNATCFSMTDEKGDVVEINVIMADDQVTPQERNDIVIQIDEGLKENETYTLLINKDLESKSGINLDSPITLTFSTINPNSSNNWWAIIAALIVLLIIVIYQVNKRKK